MTLWHSLAGASMGDDVPSREVFSSRMEVTMACPRQYLSRSRVQNVQISLNT